MQIKEKPQNPSKSTVESLMDIMGNLSRKGQRTRRTNKSNPQAAVENNLCPIVNTVLNFCPLTCEASGLGSRFGSGHQIVFSVKPRSLQ